MPSQPKISNVCYAGTIKIAITATTFKRNLLNKLHISKTTVAILFMTNILSFDKAAIHKTLCYFLAKQFNVNNHRTASYHTTQSWYFWFHACIYKLIQV